MKKQALKLILNNELVIIPTDTVYGLMCRYDSKSAVEKIYKLKKRDRKKPLILLGYNWNALKKFVDLRKISIKTCRGMSQLMKEQWPGPLTLVLPASKKVPAYLNKGYKTIGIRVPNNKFLLSLLKSCPGKVLASTSANISGKTNVNDIAQGVKLFVRAKRGEMSLKPSTVTEIKKNKLTVLR